MFIMEFIRGLHNIKPHHRGCILTIGNFDGFHLGHQSLIAMLNKQKNYCNLPVMAMIFEPQPQEFFSQVITIRLTRLRDKVHYLFAAGVDLVLCLEFNKKLASVPACNFIKKILICKLGIRYICIGNDFRFGLYRQGDVDFLKKMGRNEGFQVICANTCLDKYGNKISSTAIRTALIENRIMDAELLMGHSYCISGKVVYGNELGRTIGFPTANISLQGKKLPVQGVYAVEVYGISNLPLPGIANIGIRPTITNIEQQKLEVHILNISMNLYCYHISVVILAKIRDEKQFCSIKMLKNQIQHDVKKVHNYFNKSFKRVNGIIFYV